MRDNRSYDLEEMGSPTASHHVQSYLRSVSSDMIPLDEDDLERDMRETPDEVLEADTLNSAESYLITYRNSGTGPEVGSEVVEFYDIGDEVVISGEGKYFQSVKDIMQSENPSRTSSREALNHKVSEGLETVKARLGG